MSAFDAYVQAAFHGGVMAGGPTFTVVHDAETPLRAGYCDSIVEFFRRGPAAGTSAHAMVDPVKAVKMLPDNVVAYAAGPKANPKGWHLEQAGYAKFKRVDWTTADGMAQMRRAGACLREVHDTWGIPKRWCTDDQLRRAALGDRSSGGMSTHQQVSRVIGGTTHTDPETNYPRDLLLELVLDDVLEDDMANSDDILATVKNIEFHVLGANVAERRYDMLQSIESMVKGNDPDPNRNNFHWVANVVTAAVAAATGQVLGAIAGGVKVDASGVQVAIEEATAQAIAKASQDEADRRARDGDPATGPVS